MNKLVLVRHTAGLPAIDYHGFTVKGGSWFGFVKTPFGIIPAAWSGWTSYECIYLYTLTASGWHGSWFDETVFEDVLSAVPIREHSGVAVLGEPDAEWFGDDPDLIPFFVRAE